MRGLTLKEFLESVEGLPPETPIVFETGDHDVGVFYQVNQGMIITEPKKDPEILYPGMQLKKNQLAVRAIFIQ